jgi:anti-sigma B factor antagonist
MGRAGDNDRRGLPQHDPRFLRTTFSIASLQDEATVYVLVSGELDVGTAPHLAAELRQAQRSGLDIVVDLEQVEFIDCAGLHALVHASASAGLDRLSVTTGTPQVRRLFDLVGVDDLLRVRPGPLRIDRSPA